MPLLKVETISKSPFGDINDRQHKFTIKVGSGAKGDRGEQGDKGETGERGLQGVQGIQGSKGDKGDRGEQGDKGETGERGLQGVQGIQGSKGDKGDRGDTGLINGATQVKVDSTTKVMYNGSSIPANTAASRIIGTATGNVPEFESYLGSNHGLARMGYGGSLSPLTSWDEVPTLTGFYRSLDNTNAKSPFSNQWSTRLCHRFGPTSGSELALGVTSSVLAVRAITTNGETAWATVYTTANTTKDSNGFIKAASPIVRVFADKIETNEDAESQNVDYIKNGIGDYTLKNTSGLSTDGWYIELPKDINGNPKVAVTLTEANGVITLKSYKRIFSMATFTFEPDLNEPLDIPEGRWIDLRLNDVPIDDDLLSSDM